MQINIFCEASKEIGLGHLMRCLRLKKILQKLDFKAFVYQRGEDYSLADECLEWFEENSLEKILLNTDIAFIDSYQASQNIYEKIAKKVKKLIILDDNNRLNYPKNALILNGALNANKLYNEPQNHLLGVEFLITDENFLASKIPKKEVQNVLVSFGGGDRQACIQEVLNILCNEPYTFHIVSKYPFEMPSLKNIRSYIDISSKQMAELMALCDVAIGSGGGVLNELMMSQLPSIIIPIASNQIFQAQEWEKIGGVILSSFENLSKDFKTLLQKRKEMLKACANIPFGKQLPSRLKEIILQCQKQGKKE